MQIGNWKSVAGMDQTYREARELGIETNTRGTGSIRLHRRSA